MNDVQKENRIVYILGPDLTLSKDLEEELAKNKAIIIKTDEAEITTSNPVDSLIDHIKNRLNQENIIPKNFYISGHGSRHNNKELGPETKANNHFIRLKEEAIFTGDFLSKLQEAYPNEVNFNLSSCYSGSAGKESKRRKLYSNRCEC